MPWIAQSIRFGAPRARRYFANGTPLISDALVRAEILAGMRPDTLFAAEVIATGGGFREDQLLQTESAGTTRRDD